MQASRAICDTCGHTRDWHDRAAVRARLLAEPPDERPCYREVGGAPCRCSGFRESGDFAVRAGSGTPRATSSGFEVVRVAAIALVFVVLGLGLLYAYRSQSPSVPEVDVSQALRDISAGRVRAVTVIGTTATLEFRDSPSHKEQTTVPEPDTVLTRAVSDYNAANPSQAIEIRHTQDGQTIGVIGPIVLSLLPVVLIGGFFYYLMGSRRRS